MRRIHLSLGLLLAVILLGTPVVAQAQESGEASDSRTFGLTSSVSHTIQALAFEGESGIDPAAWRTTLPFRARYCSATATCLFAAPVFLPAGALVTSIQLEACDTHPAAEVHLSVIRLGALEGSIQGLSSTTTGIEQTPGCTQITQALATPHTIDNVNNTYIAEVAIQPAAGDAIDISTRFQAVRLFYNLQLSPEPATATFDDVPTNHPFFQFIETLWAAGITSGCSASPLLYCPDDPLTRGEAAVFFGKALGLQFAP